jgi:hypothetical protein
VVASWNRPSPAGVSVELAHETSDGALKLVQELLHGALPVPAPPSPGRQCLQCGEEVAPGQAWCTKCDASISAPGRVCANPACGKPLREGLKFCPYCSHPVAAGPAEARVGQCPPEPSRIEPPPLPEQKVDPVIDFRFVDPPASLCGDGVSTAALNLEKVTGPGFDFDIVPPVTITADAPRYRASGADLSWKVHMPWEWDDVDVMFTATMVLKPTQPPNVRRREVTRQHTLPVRVFGANPTLMAEPEPLTINATSRDNTTVTADLWLFGERSDTAATSNSER